MGKDRVIALQLSRFGVGYKGRGMLLEGVDAAFGCGTLTALLGRNGAGKSTMLRAIAGLGPFEGEVLIDGKSSALMNAPGLARRISFVGSGRERVAALRCRDVVSMGRSPYTGWTGRLSAADSEIVEEAMAALGLEDFADRHAHTLSDGEYQRLMIARALAQDTPVMILDEPTSFLDLPNRYELCSLLARLAHERARCIIFSTHELDIALGIADRTALIDNPRLIVDTPDAIRHSGILRRLFDPDGRVGLFS